MRYSRREFLGTATALAVAATCGTGRGGLAGDADWLKERRKLASRRRRIIYNDDGDARYPLVGGGPPKDVADFLGRRFDWTRDTQVDSLFWCIGDGQEPPWGLPLPKGFDATATILSAAREAGQEAVISLRMNDIHDAFGTVKYPFKLENRNMLIEPDGARGKWPKSDLRFWTWSALDYAFEEVRDHKFAYISKFSEKYLPDGVELDYFRHPAFFKQGEEEKNLAVMTEFIRRIRRRLDEIGRAAGRPILLSARLADTPGKSIKMGLDGPAWLKEGLLDVLIIGGGYAPYCTAWTEYRDLAAKYDVPSYPCFNCSLAHHSGSVEPLRGAASNWWHLGADGVYLFNPFVPVDLKTIPAETMYGELKRLGSPQTLAGLDKVFQQEYVGGGSVLMRRMTADLPPPTSVSTTPKTVPLVIGDDLSKIPPGKKVRCQLRLAVKPADAPLTVKLNAKDLAEGRMAEDKWREFDVPVSTLQQGNNALSVADGNANQPARLERVHLWVKYEDL